MRWTVAESPALGTLTVIDHHPYVAISPDGIPGVGPVEVEGTMLPESVEKSIDPPVTGIDGGQLDRVTGPKNLSTPGK